MNFSKMHGNGNDFIIIEDLDNKYYKKESELAKEVCHRHFGIGADGILLVRKAEQADIEMVIINSDGSYAAMCGNGIRCFAKYVYEKGIVKKDKFLVLTGDGIKEISLDIVGGIVNYVRVNMGKPSFNPKNIPALSEYEVINKDITINEEKFTISSMLMGVPHTIIFEEDEVPIILGKDIEHYKIFPNKTNVNFCKVIDTDSIKVRTWERGAGATLGCGTGNCAAAIMAHKLGYVKNLVNVYVPGGSLKVEICDDGVYMIGNAEFICDGSYNFREG